MLAAIPFSLAIGGVVIVTSIISGIFGMAGGLVLMLILGIVLPVQSAMVLHGITQFLPTAGARCFGASGSIGRSSASIA